MTPIVTTPSLSLTFQFPLIDKSISVDAAPVMHRIKSNKLVELVSCSADLEDESLVFSLLRAHPDEALLEMRADYLDEYRKLNRQLREHRGYGLEGDEAPKMSLDALELITWLESNNQVVLNLALVDYLGPDLQFEKVGKAWTWRTRKEPSYILPQALGGRASHRTWPSERSAIADAVSTLGLLAVVRQHLRPAN